MNPPLEPVTQAYTLRPTASPLGALPWPPPDGQRVRYQRAPAAEPIDVTVCAHVEHALGSGPLRNVTLRAADGREFAAPWDRCSEPTKP